MRKEKLLDLIGQVDCKYIDEANVMNKNVYWLKWCAAVACIVLCLCGTIAGRNLYQDFNKEVSYVCLDVNPSFELCLNNQDKVVKAIAYNEDGKAMLDNIEYKNKHYENVISDILHHDEFKKYLTEDLTITIVSKDDTVIQQNIKKCIESAKYDGQVVCSDMQTRKVAYSNHCSVGKYIAYEELSQYDQDITLEDCKGMTMHEIYEQIDKHHSSHHTNENNQINEYQNATHSGHHTSHH